MLVHVVVTAVFLLYSVLPLGKVPAPIPATVTAGAPTAARVLLKQRSEDPSIGRSSASTGLATGSPTSPSEDASVVGRGAGTAGGEAEDDHSDKGTYTIELETRNLEEEEARRMIDKVFRVYRDLSVYMHHVDSFMSFYFSRHNNLSGLQRNACNASLLVSARGDAFGIPRIPQIT